MGDDEEELPPARKVFIHNVGGYLGANLSKAFAAIEEERFEVIGTLKPDGVKPRTVSRVVENTPEAMSAAFYESELTVLDLLGQGSAAQMMLEAIAGEKELETDKVLVGISSVMTWTRTSADADEPEKALTEDEYKRRRPHSNFKELLALEKLVTKAKRTGLRTHVVAAGLTYGAEEDLFHSLFKTAWSCKPLPMLSISDGANLLPTIHVKDLCSVVVKLMEGDSLPYLLAVDAASAGGEEAPPQSLKAVISALSAELGVAEVFEMPNEEVRGVADFEFFQIGSSLESNFGTSVGTNAEEGAPPNTGLKLAAAAINDMGFEWHSQEGLLANMGKVVYEYREARGLLPLRLLVHGNDDLAKAELARTVAAEYKLPLVKATEVVEEAAAQESELGAELKTAMGAGPVPDALMLKVLSAALTTTECRNQGYVLEGFPETLAQASPLFPAPPAEGEEEAPAEEEGEEGGSGAKKIAPAAPELVICLEASDETVKHKVLAQPEPSVTEEQLTEKLAAYATNNAEDSPTSVLALPAIAAVEALPVVVAAETTNDMLMGKARVYLGAPRNYGPSEEELAAKAALEEEAARKKEAEEEAAKAERDAAEVQERQAREAEESNRLAELRQKERELLEVRSIPLRNYLMQNVIPTLTEGLIEVCKLKPEDPVDYLAEWLFKNNPVEEELFDN